MATITKGKRYTLANYTLTITPSAELKAAGFSDTISVGGEGDYIGTITAGNGQSNVWSTTGYATGAWIHTKNLNRTGSISVTVSQLADQVIYFIRLVNTYFTAANVGGLTMTISDASNNDRAVVEAIDCFPTSIPDISYAASAGSLNFEFTCGRLTFMT